MILARVDKDIYNFDEKEFEKLRKKLFDFVNAYLEILDQNKEIKTLNSDFRKWME